MLGPSAFVQLAQRSGKLVDAPVKGRTPVILRPSPSIAKLHRVRDITDMTLFLPVHPGRLRSPPARLLSRPL